MARNSSTQTETTAPPSALDLAAQYLRDARPFLRADSPILRQIETALTVGSERAARAALDDLAEAAEGESAEALKRIREQLVADAMTRAPRAVCVATLRADGSVSIAQRHTLDPFDDATVEIVVATSGPGLPQVLPRLVNLAADLPARISCAARGLDFAALAAKAEALKAQRRAAYEASAAKIRAEDSRVARGLGPSRY